MKEVFSPKQDKNCTFSKKVRIETYGCQMNVADSEVVATMLQMAGYDTTEVDNEADAVIINTCSIRDNAEQKIYSRIAYWTSLRRKLGKRIIIGIIGCMAERLQQELIDKHGVDLVAGPDAYLDIPNLVAAAEVGQKAINIELSTTETYRDIIPKRLGSMGISGFVSIMRGCNNFCSYCIVPYTRGRERSREPRSILTEVADLRARGFKEVTLLGQNVNSYRYNAECRMQNAECRMQNAECNAPHDAPATVPGHSMGVEESHSPAPATVPGHSMDGKETTPVTVPGHSMGVEESHSPAPATVPGHSMGVEESHSPAPVPGHSMDGKETTPVTVSGHSMDGKVTDFPALLAMVAEAAPDMRIRFTTSHPKDMSDKTLRVVASHPNIARSIHLPVQSGSNKVLKLMNRKYTREWYLDRIAAIRRIVPDAGISTDMFTGFHDETEEDFEQTLSLMREVGFDSAFMFKYSERPGTYASRELPDNVPEDVKIDRLNRMIALQNELSLQSNRNDIGKEFEVLIEGVSKRSRDQLFGRTSQNKVVVFDRGNHRPGQFIRVRITDATSATLHGMVI